MQEVPGGGASSGIPLVGPSPHIKDLWACEGDRLLADLRGGGRSEGEDDFYTNLTISSPLGTSSQVSLKYRKNVGTALSCIPGSWGRPQACCTAVWLRDETLTASARAEASCNFRSLSSSFFPQRSSEYSVDRRTQSCRPFITKRGFSVLPVPCLSSSRAR
jgi:hypothetical protein